MTSQQLEKIETSCKPCIFAEWDGDEQVGCKASILEELKEQDIVECYDDEKKFFVLNRLCTGFRPTSWNDSVADVDKMKEESTVSFSIVIFCENMTQEEAYNLRYFVDDILYHSGKIQVIIGHDENFEYREEIAVFVRALSKYGFQYRIVEYYSDLPSGFKEKDVLKRIEKSYFTLYNYKGSNLTDLSDSLNCLNGLINDQGKKIVVMDSKSGVILSRMLLNHYVYDYYQMQLDLIESAKSTEYYYKYENN